MSDTISRTRLAFGMLFGAVLGFVAIVGPAVWYPPAEGESTALFPLIYRAVRQLQPLSALSLVLVAGFLATLVTRQRRALHAVIAGASTVVSLPLWSILDLLFGDSHIERHNMLPIEWLIYAFIGGFGVVGALLAFLAARIGRTLSAHVAQR